MTPINFCYWLQGYFEISGSEGLSLGQQKIVMNHLDLTEKWVGGNVEQNGNRIPEKFTALFSSIKTVEKLSSGEVWPPKMVQLVKNDLNGCFEHVIDPIMEDNNTNSHLFDQSHGGDFNLRC